MSSLRVALKLSLAQTTPRPVDNATNVTTNIKELKSRKASSGVTKSEKSAPKGATKSPPSASANTAEPLQSKPELHQATAATRKRARVPKPRERPRLLRRVSSDEGDLVASNGEAMQALAGLISAGRKV